MVLDTRLASVVEAARSKKAFRIRMVDVSGIASFTDTFAFMSGGSDRQNRAIADAVPVPVIASGGVGTLDHLVEGVREGHVSAVLAASIFHYGMHSIGEAKRHMAAAGLNMRLDG